MMGVNTHPQRNRDIYRCRSPPRRRSGGSCRAFRTTRRASWAASATPRRATSSSPTARRTATWQVNLSRRSVFAHVVVLEAFDGSRPEGYQASHLNGDRCDNRIANLAWETPVQNNRRKALHGTQPAGDKHPCSRKTHCKWGNEFTAENTHRTRRQRQCKTCARLRARVARRDPATRERQAAYMRAKRAAKAAERRADGGSARTV